MTTGTDLATPPPTIIAAFFGFLASSLSALATGAILLVSRKEITDTLRRSDPSLTEDALDTAVTITLGLTLGVVLVIALVYLWLSFKLKAGRNWARIVLTVFTLLQLASLVTSQGNTVLSFVSCAIAVVALVLSYLPASNAYIAAVKRAG